MPPFKPDIMHACECNPRTQRGEHGPSQHSKRGVSMLVPLLASAALCQVRGVFNVTITMYTGGQCSGKAVFTNTIESGRCYPSL